MASIYIYIYMKIFITFILIQKKKTQFIVYFEQYAFSITAAQILQNGQAHIFLKNVGYKILTG